MPENHKGCTEQTYSQYHRKQSSAEITSSKIRNKTMVLSLLLYMTVFKVLAIGVRQEKSRKGIGHSATLLADGMILYLKDS